jgi:hypothetical protein
MADRDEASEAAAAPAAPAADDEPAGAAAAPWKRTME